MLVTPETLTALGGVVNVALGGIAAIIGAIYGRRSATAAPPTQSTPMAVVCEATAAEDIERIVKEAVVPHFHEVQVVLARLEGKISAR